MGESKIEREKYKPLKPGKRELPTDVSARQRNERRRNRGAVESFDWTSAAESLVVRLVVSATRAGAAVQFSNTRDGGAGRIRILDGDEFFDYHVRPSEDVNLLLETLAVDFE